MRLPATVAIAFLLSSVVAGARQPYDLTVDAPPSLAGVAARVEAMNAAGLARALSHAGLELPPRVHVLLIPEDDPRARQTPSWVVGQALGTDRMIVYPQRVGSYPYDSLESVVLHELVHLALTARAGGRDLPRWFQEGVAVSVESGWGIGSQARLLVAAARDPRIDDVSMLFESDAVPETTTAYLLSAALVEDLRRRHGLALPGVIAARVAEGQHFDAAFFSETGETVDEAAARAWRVYRGIRWLPIVTSASSLWTWMVGLAFLAFMLRWRRRRERRRRWDEEEKLAATAESEESGEC